MTPSGFNLEKEEEQDGPVLREYWNILLKRFWTVVLVFIAITSAAALYTLRQPKIYEAKTTVIIDFQPPRLFGNSIDEGVTSNGSWYTQNLYFDTQLEVIASRHIAERVVRDLGLAENLEFLGLTHIESEAELASALEHSDPAEKLRSMIIVEPQAETRIVAIKVQNRNPELAAELANAVATAYKDQNIEQRLESMQDAFDWLERQYETYELKLAESTTALTRFKADNPLLFTNPAEQQTLTNARLNELSRRLIDIESNRRQMGYILKELKDFKVDRLGTGGLRILTSGQNLDALTSKYISVRIEEQKARKIFQPGTPEVETLEAQRKLLESAIEAEIKSIRTAYQANYDALKRAESDLRSELTAVKAEAQTLDQLQLLYGQVESQKAEQQRLFELVQRRLNEVNLTKLLEANNIRVLDSATVPGGPVKPNVPLNILLGASVGLLLGVLLAVGLEMFDNTIKSQEDIEQKLGLPFLGVIPKIRPSDKRGNAKVPEGVEYRPDLHSHFFPKSSVAECARTIRTNILFMSPGKVPQLLLVTSPSPLEGKTSTAVNLGTVMAQSDSKVLLIEADMRRPRLYKALDVHPTTGLSECLVGAVTLDDAILPTSVPNLDILPCGPIPPNPSELFHTPEFAKVVEQLRERYDRIIVDSPPIIAVTDALILAQHVDGVVIVTRPGSTRSELLKRSKQLLNGINAPILGTILNNVNLENRRYGTYYYYYYRRHGRYYADEPAEDSPS